MFHIKNLILSFLAIGMGTGLFNCSNQGRPEGSTAVILTPPDSAALECEAVCNAATPAVPKVTDTGGYGNVTTYGSVTNPEPSQGGACNYGDTQIYGFAAIHVHLQPGDNNGPWNDGRICGACARVWVATDSGFASTKVRIVDKCPDDFCGIDLGGLPAREVMGPNPGRYSGQWEWEICDSPNLFDGPTTLHVKEGSNNWWSLIQIRNGPDAVDSLRFRRDGQKDWRHFSWAEEAENFWFVPDSLLQDSGLWEIEANLKSKGSLKWFLRGGQLAMENADYLVGE